MLKLRRVTKVNVFFLVLVYVFNFDLFEFSAAILEKGLFGSHSCYELHYFWRPDWFIKLFVSTIDYEKSFFFRFAESVVHDRLSPPCVTQKMAARDPGGEKKIAQDFTRPFFRGFFFASRTTD